LKHTPTTVICLTLLLFAAGCDFFSKQEERVVIAKVRDSQLYLDELTSVMPAGLNPTDSLNFANGFIQNWATQTLLLQKAELNLSESEKNVSAQLEEYRRSLIIYKYQRQLVGQLLDTVITEAQIQEYYDNNKDNFELQDNIARALLVKLDIGSKDVEKVRKLCRSDKQEDRDELQEFCMQHARSFHLNDQTWIPFGELMAQLPPTAYLNLNYFHAYNYAHVQDSAAHYLLDVKEIKYKNSVSPIEFEKQNIRNILLNQRKLELIRKLEKDILDEAISKDQFKIVNN
jgi:hypothetical protein